MNSEVELFDDLCSQLEATSDTANNVNKIRKRKFVTQCPYEERSTTSEPPLQLDVSSPTTSSAELAPKLDAIHKRLDELYAKLDSVETRQVEVGDTVKAMQGALSEKLPERAEVQAQGKLLRECKVLTARVQQSVSRITGDMESEESIELAGMLPMLSVEQVEAVESKLKNKPYSDAMISLLARAKGTRGTVDGVMRQLFHDSVMGEYNLVGRAGKNSLVDLKVIDLLYDIFPEKPKELVRLDLRKYISCSHNRNYQKKYLSKIKVFKG